METRRRLFLAFFHARAPKEKGTTPFMRSIKRTLALLLALTLTVSLLPSAALAAEETDSPSPVASVTDPDETEDNALVGTESTEPESADAPAEQTPIEGNTPTSDAEIQAALETFDPTIDDPQYLREYNRQQQTAEDDGISLFATGTNPYTGKTFTHTHAKTKYIYYGIDVSQWQGTIDWKKVKADGISFVFIRCSYTSLSKFSMYTDPKFKTNVEGAAAAGLKVGVYHYSGATSTTEAKKEVNYVLDLLSPYKSKIALPVMFDYETNGSDRVYTNYKKTSKATRTKYATTFCDAAKAAGYSAGVYCSTSWFSDFFTPSSFSGYSNWVAQWSTKNTYTGPYDFWQYAGDSTITGKVNGISGLIDCNFWYTDTKISGATSSSGDTTDTTTPEAASKSLTTPYVTNASVNYRMTPGTSGTKVGTLAKGTVIDLVYGYYKTVSGENWYKFNYNGNAYYIHEDYVDMEVLQNHTASSSVNYYASASTAAATKGTFSSGSNISVVQGSSQTVDGVAWYTVKVGSAYYYVQAEALTPAETFVASSAKKKVNVRAKAGTDQTKVTTIYAGTPVTLVNGGASTVSGERWEKVKIGTSYDYILASYLTKTTASNDKALTSSNTTLKLSYSTTPYTGSALKPSVTVTYNGTKLVKDTDYTVSYSNNKEPGTATVKITGQGNYSGSLSKTFQITALTVSYVTTSKLHYRTGCGTSYTSKGTVAKNKPVEVVYGWSKTASGNKWYKVKISGKYYYMMAKYLKQETRVQYTTTSKLNYRSGAGTSYASKGTLAKGAAVQVVKGWSKKVSGNTWYQIRIKNSYYYVMSKYLKKAETVTLYTTTAKVHIRSGPSSSKTKVATIAKGTTVPVISGGQQVTDGETWQLVKVNTSYYYILGSYLKK